ncbi:ATP-grasp domain-containing protein [Streptomyces sp. WMMC500]|uniref:ATP-grasp domain-containing protein n=1 Tax=Streptomyces sp. WMMC500 TaxID=3015154 RepID=UPI00248AD789|nr:ATP-grasp domain-containing protein [Streptomyces sp. WMMC500]WBB60921.1 ATP-grasp domain-containing protein [Streptomyces sp. WMMC500]
MGVLYDAGSADAAEVAAAARCCGVELFLVVDRASHHVRDLLPVLTRRFALCDITGLDTRKAARAVATFLPDGLLTFSEHRMELTSAIAAALDIPYWHSPAVTGRLVDKLQQRRTFAEAGLDDLPFAPVAGTADLDAALDAVGLPAVLKPRRGAGGRLVHRLDSFSGARAAVAACAAAAPGADLLVEALLPGDPAAAGPQWGDYVSVETAVHRKECRPLCVTGKFPLVEPFRERGSFVPHTLDTPLAERAESLAEAAIGALDISDGIVHTELKLTADGPRLIEVNGRLGGLAGDVVRRGSGFDMVAAAMRLALGLPVPDAPRFEAVTYQYTLMPPAGGAGHAPATGGPELCVRLDGLLHLPGVDLGDLPAGAVPSSDPRDGAVARLGRLHGRTPDHAELARVVAAIDALCRQVPGVV